MASAMNPEQCANELARLLDAQVIVCRQILDKSRMQQELVEERREDDLLILLDGKQQLIEKHQKLSQSSVACREQWEQTARNSVGAEAHAKVEKAWNNLREVLDEIVQLEDASRAMLQDRKGEVSMDINKLQRGKIVNKAYGGSGMRPPPAARFSDQQG